MRPFEQDWLELGRRVACSLHYQHPRNLRLVRQPGRAGASSLSRGSRERNHSGLCSGRFGSVAVCSFGR
jgi:hypothetical protein